MRPTHLAVLAAAVALVPALPQAQRPSSTVRLVVEAPLKVEIDLQRAAKEGYTCAAVARPVAPLLPNNVAVILTRPVGPPLPAPAIEVVVARAGPIDDFQDAVNKMAATGFRVCGLTITVPVWGRPNVYTPVAVMTKVDGPPPEYRVVRSRGQRDQWQMLEQSAAAGFLVSHLVARPEPAGADTSEIVFMAEKTAATPPSVYQLVFAGNAPSLQKSVDALAGQGHRIQGMWAANTRVSVLMAKPIQGAWPDPREYEVDDPSQLRLSSTDGELVGLVRYAGGMMGFYNRKNRQENTVTSGEIVDAVQRPSLRVASETWFVDKLHGDGGRGYQPLDFALRPGKRGELLAEVVLRRTPAP